MKRTLQNFLIMAFAVISFMSCNNDDGKIPDYDAPKIARFEDGDRVINIAENSEEYLEIPVYINYASERPITISYEIEGNTDAIEDLSTTPGKVEILAQEKTGVIILRAINNDDYNEPQNQVIIRIVEADGNYDLPDDMVIGFEEKIINLIDDDCQFAPSGNYNAVSSLDGEDVETFEPDVTPVNGDENTFDVNTAWGPNFVAILTGNDDYKGNFLYSGRMTINDDYSVNFIGESDSMPGGTGTYDPCTDEISLVLVQNLFTNPFTVDVIFSTK